MRDSKTFDNLMLLKDAGAVIASGAATVGGQPRVIDLGAQQGAGGDGIATGARMKAEVIIDTSAIDTSDGNETYDAVLQGCQVVGFGSGVVELASMRVTAAQRNKMRFDNQQGDTVYEFIRLFFNVAGTTPSLNCVAWIAKD